MEAPVDAQTVLFPLHAPLALAAMQGAGQKCRHGIGALAPGPGAQLHAAVAGHALAQSPQAWAARLVTRAQVPGHEAVSAGQGDLQQGCGTGEGGTTQSQRFSFFFFIYLLFSESSAVNIKK